jgi:hypothetical protein
MPNLPEPQHTAITLAQWVGLQQHDLEPLHVLEQWKRAAELFSYGPTGPTATDSLKVGPSWLPAGLPEIRKLIDNHLKGVPMTSAPVAPTVAPPEMNLTVDRNEWVDILRVTTGHMLAYGFPGTGKSYDFALVAAEAAAAKTAEYNKVESPADHDRPTRIIEHEEVNCTRQTSAAGWVGHWIDGGPAGFLWNDGPVSRAMKAGVPIVINDVHLCSDDLYDLLFFVLDSRAGAKYSLPNGSHLKAEPGFRALLSMNGDPLQVLDEPIRDRLTAQYEINVPSEAAIKKLDRDVRAFCRRVYSNAASEGGTPRFTYRTFQAFCQLRRETGDWFKAAALACGDEKSARALLEPLLIRTTPS